MSFIETATKNRRKQFGLCSSTETKYEVINGKRLVVKRLLKGFSANASYLDAFKAEFEACSKLNHKNVLAYRSFGRDENGDYILMGTDDFISLEQLIKEHPSMVFNRRETDRIIQEILAAVHYLHQHSVCLYNLCPSSILLTRKGHQVKVINPGSFYADCKPPIFIGDEHYLAPELTADSIEWKERVDIFSIGAVINYIYSYSTLPIKYRSVIKRCLSDAPAKRYSSVRKVQSAISRGGVCQRFVQTALFLCVTSVVSLFVWSIVKDFVEPEVGFIAPARNSEHTMKYLQDSIQQSGDSLGGPTEEQIKATAEYERKAQDIFKKQFRKEADKVISKMYTPQNMNGNEMAFRQMSADGFSELQKVANGLAEQYGMDATQSAQMAQEVIQQITKQKMNEIQTKSQE